MLTPRIWREQWDRLRDEVLPQTWHLVGTDRALRTPGSWAPATLLPGTLDEPLLFVNDGGTLRAFSNVCPHRLATVAEEVGSGRNLRCPYHGRVFGLDGVCRGQPGWDSPLDAGDDLRPAPFARWRGLLFASVRPERTFHEEIAEIDLLLGAADWADARVEDGPTYTFDAPWVAWVENFLEGLHIPHVHPGLNRLLTGYEVRLAGGGSSAQGSLVHPEVPALQLPAEHPWSGARVGGIYACFFPTTMLNLYPWGVSLNLVQPLGPGQTRVRYQYLVLDDALRSGGAGSDLDTVEAEDQAMVGRVARGMSSRFAAAPRLTRGPEAGVAAWHAEIRRRLGAGSQESGG